MDLTLICLSKDDFLKKIRILRQELVDLPNIEAPEVKQLRKEVKQLLIDVTYSTAGGVRISKLSEEQLAQATRLDLLSYVSYVGLEEEFKQLMGFWERYENLKEGK